MYLFKKEHLGRQMHNKNDCCMTEEQGMDIHLGFLKHPKMLQIYLHHTLIMTIERFSNDCRKTKTKAIITPTNHNRSSQHDEPIRIPSNHL